MTARPTAHDRGCRSSDGFSGPCECSLKERQRIFDLERRVAELESELEAAGDEALVAAELAEDCP